MLLVSLLMLAAASALPQPARDMPVINPSPSARCARKPRCRWRARWASIRRRQFRSTSFRRRRPSWPSTAGSTTARRR